MRLQPKTTISIALLVLATVGYQQDKSLDSSALTATEVIDRMAETYSKCKTYRDTGTVTTVFKSNNKPNTNIIEFATAMARPNQFRFEYTDKGNAKSRYLVWQQGTDVRTWWDITQKREDPKSLGLAVAGATGVSGGAAHRIPALLMPPEIGGLMLTDLKKAKRGEDKVIDKHKCFTVTGQFADNPTTIWIDQKSFLVRKVESTSEFEATSNRAAFSTHTSTTYDPVINKDVPSALLKYDAPK